MENKYYTPELEEFYIGFEYEKIVGWAISTEKDDNNDIKKIIFNHNNNKYDNTKFDINDLGRINSNNELSYVSIKQHIKQFNCRVKYLDKEDIESLGWKLITEEIKTYDSHWCYFKYNNKHQLHVQLGGKYFPRLLNIGALRIYIKNKSELKKLMKQLAIID